jgi:putative FmdB family regulatory protein
MPTYDFVCMNCGQRFDIFLTFDEYGKRKVTCVHCGHSNVRRRMTKVRIARSEESRMDSIADESALEGMQDDPRALGRMMKKMGNEMGEDLPPEFDDMVDRLEAGQSPDEIESALPDLGSDSAGADSLDDDL